jgi:hypothetical protein
MSDALPEEVVDAIDQMIQYLVDSERSDYFDGDSEHRADHIYRAVYTVAEWRGLNLDHPDQSEADHLDS